MSHDPTLPGLRARLVAGSTPAAEFAAARRRAVAWNDPALFLHLPQPQQAPAGDGGALAGAAIAVKDNIDVVGMPTTAGCPSYAYSPGRDAEAVTRLRAAGAAPLGKTNLDQFATGLVGTRSPHGTPRNPFDPAYIPGGSSSGSACAVAAGIVPLALGTDTAGSGRIPAAFTGIVGLKPTRGLISARGVVPAVRSLDCVSIFALTVADAWEALGQVGGFDAEDAFSRERPEVAAPTGALRIGIPGAGPLSEVDAELRACYLAALEALRGLGHELVEIDASPFLAAGRLLYEGAWVAERTAAVGDFLDRRGTDADPVVAGIIAGGRRHDAVAAWRGTYELARLRRLADAQWRRMDLLALPAAPLHPTLAQVRSDPVGVNSRLGTFTNFANLLDTCALALPAGLTTQRRPAGLTLFAPAWHEAAVCRVGAQLQSTLSLPLGATGFPAPATQEISSDDGIVVAVFGAHLRGQPLNRQLLELGGAFAGDCRTAARYRCFLISGKVERPGLVLARDGGVAIAGELWRLPAAGFGRLTASIAPPLAIGTIALDDGRQVKGFVCEAEGAAGAPDISAHGGWRGFLSSRAKSAGGRA